MRRKWIAAPVAALVAASVICGCANPQKAGVKALEEGNYEEALAQFQEAATERSRRKDTADLAWHIMKRKTIRGRWRHFRRR